MAAAAMRGSGIAIAAMAGALAVSAVKPATLARCVALFVPARAILRTLMLDEFVPGLSY